MKNILYIIVLAALMAFTFDIRPSPCSPGETKQIEPINPTAQRNTSRMWVDNTTFYEGDSIKLHFSSPNDPYLGIVDPEGHFFYIVFPAEDALENMKPFVDSKHFIDLKTMDIHTPSFEADPYQYGVDKNQSVFTKSGDYTFIMGQNLHVDDPRPLDHLTIHYVRGSRPGSTTKTIAMN